ncbi:MAG: NAD(P)-dependent oxidoreductase [Verrucomicrobiota bacterium]
MITDFAKTRVAFIGLGVMGNSMAGHLLAAGCLLSIFTRTASKAKNLIERGAIWKDTPEAAVENADFVFSIVGDPSDVEAIYLNDPGIISTLPSGSVAVDMTTSSPTLARRIADAGSKKNIQVLDAPVSGGDLGARSGKLSIMVGGDRLAYEKTLPFLEKMGANIVYQGVAGAGQSTKMCNQIAIGGSMLGMVEALTFAKSAKLDPETVLKSISTGAAGSWSLDNLAPRILRNDFEAGFFVHHFIKDMRIALSSAQDMGLDLPGLELSLRQYEALASSGYAFKGTQALANLYFAESEKVAK